MTYDNLSDPSMDELSYFFTISPSVMCVLDTQFRFTLVNPAFERMLGCSHKNVAQKDFLEIVHTDECETVRTMLDMAARNQDPVTFACRCQVIGGELKQMLWSAYPRDGGMYSLVATDLTPFQTLEGVEASRNLFAEALLDTVIAINSSLSLDDILTRIMLNFGRVISSDYVNIMLIEEGYAYTVVSQSTVAGQTIDQAISDLRIHLDHNHYLHRMAETNLPVIIYDMQEDANWRDISNVIDITGSCVGCPISLNDEVIGFLHVISFEENYYTSIHAQQLLMFANQVAIAIKNSRLFEQAKENAILQERQRIARELHDSVNQTLFAANTFVKSLPRVLEKKPEKVSEYVRKIGQRIHDAIVQMRLILIELHPEALIQTDLGTLLEKLCNAHTGNTGTPIILTVSDGVFLNETAHVAYYRIAQEALHNIEKHARASQVIVELNKTDGQVTLRIEDDGRGFHLDDVSPGHFGIQNMYDRAASIGAQLIIESESNGFTRISLEGKSS